MVHMVVPGGSGMSTVWDHISGIVSGKFRNQFNHIEEDLYYQQLWEDPVCDCQMIKSHLKTFLSQTMSTMFQISMITVTLLLTSETLIGNLLLDLMKKNCASG